MTCYSVTQQTGCAGGAAIQCPPPNLVTIEIPGPQGPPGPPGGGGGGGDLYYAYTQATPASTWLVTHGLNKNPSVTVVDSAGTVVYGEVTYVSTSQVQIVFSGAFSGTVYFN